MSSLDDAVWPDHAEITDPQGIELLTNMRAISNLVPFMRDAHTLTTAAAEAGRPASSMAYWIPRLLRAGLIVHLRNESRAGAAMPVYRSPAQRLSVAFANLPFDRRVALFDAGRMRVLRQFLDGFDEQMAQTGDHLVEFSASGDHGVSVQLVERPGDQQAHEFIDAWMSFDLDEADAHALSRDFEALLTKYAAKTGGRRYLVHCGVALTPRHPWRSATD
jgi:hypothetical protein